MERYRKLWCSRRRVTASTAPKPRKLSVLSCTRDVAAMINSLFHEFEDKQNRRYCYAKKEHFWKPRRALCRTACSSEFPRNTALLYRNPRISSRTRTARAIANDLTAQPPAGRFHDPA